MSQERDFYLFFWKSQYCMVTWHSLILTKINPFTTLLKPGFIEFVLNAKFGPSVDKQNIRCWVWIFSISLDADAAATTAAAAPTHKVTDRGRVHLNFIKFIIFTPILTLAQLLPAGRIQTATNVQHNLNTILSYMLQIIFMQSAT